MRTGFNATERGCPIKLLLARVIYWLKGLSESPAELFKALGVEKTDQILEIGCAIGYHTLPLARIASEGQVYAVDVWEEALAHLDRRAGSLDNVEVICRSGDAVEFPPGSLDKVVCFDTLHELDDPEQALRRWVGFLRPGGKLLYRDPIVPAARIGALSGGRLRGLEATYGVDVFVRSDRGEERRSELDGQ
jgi:SAM-dependent methyltransferase